MPTHRAGFVAIFGKPNAGKSTLLNALVGEKLAAVSALPQTTRDRVCGIVPGDGFQAVFVDLPGLVDPTDKLNEALRARVIEGLEGVDVVLHLVDITEPVPIPREMIDLTAAVTRPIVLAANKIDTRSGKFDARSWAGEMPPPFALDRYREIIGVSALTNRNLDRLLAAIGALLPNGPPLFDPDQLTDRDLRFLASEMIREKVYYHTHQEIPYSTAVQIEQFEERDHGKWYIAAVIHVERDSQKGIVIGKGGERLKKISQTARADIERLCGADVYLEIFVRITKDWRKNDARLREFGYAQTHKKKRRG